MKKVLSLILVVCMAFSCLALSACVWEGMFGTTTSTVPTASTTQPTTKPTSTTTSTTTITTTKPAPPPPEPVDDELKWKVIDDYLIWSGILDDKKPEEIDCEFFGRYGDCAAVYFHTAGSYGERLQRYDTAGYRFIYPDSRVIRIWNDGEFYTITEAYEMGLIVEDDVASINYLFQGFEFKEPYFIYLKKDIVGVNIFQDFNGIYIRAILDPGICRRGKEFDIRFFRGVELDRIELRDEQGPANSDTCAQIYHLYLANPSKENLVEAIKVIQKIDGVRRAEPDWNKSYIWCGIDNYTNSTLSQYAIEMDEVPVLSIQDRQIWDFTAGSDAVKVGVIDTGIASHEDLDIVAPNDRSACYKSF